MVTCARSYDDTWELIEFSEVMLKNPMVPERKVFNCKEEIQIYCDQHGWKLVSIDEFNRYYNTQYYGDEC